MLAGLRRSPGPLIGTLAAAVTAATLSIAALGVATARTPAPLGRLAGADVVVAASTQLLVTTGSGDSAQTQAVPLPAYRGVPAGLAAQLARVPGVASAAGESGFPGGTVRPGLVDLVAVKAAPGVSAGTLAARIRASLHGGAGYTIADGAGRAAVADPEFAVEVADGHALGFAVLPLLIMTAMFTLAATTALSVDLRRRRFALLRAVGATRGQVRRAVLAEQALLAVAGGLLGYLPGTLLSVLAVRAMVSHGLLPAGSAAAPNGWFALLAGGVNLPACVLAALLAARRAARTSPARAVREAQAERARPHPVRLLLGLAAAAGVVVLAVLGLRQNGPGAAINLALPLLAAGLTAVTLLGPALAAATAALLRPLAGASPAGRLALAGIRRMPRRTASAVIPVALAVGMIGAIGFLSTTVAHAATVQSGQAVTAGHVLSGNGLDDRVLTAARALPGVRAAAGVAALDVAVSDPDLEYIGGEAVSAGQLGPVLDLGVASGDLSQLRPGQVAVSTVEASSGLMNVHLGSPVTVYLPDGTPYRATVSAVYQRSLALGDLLIPAAAAVGHTGIPQAYGQILVSGGSQRQLAALAAARPGARLASHDVYNAEVARNNSQNSFVNLLILGVIAALAAVTLVNTLAVSAVERRGRVRLLASVGATTRQLAWSFGWQALFVTVLGVAAGAAVGAGTLVGLSRALTGSSVPYIPAAGAGLLISVVAALTIGTVMTTFAAMTRRGAAPADLPCDDQIGGATRRRRRYWFRRAGRRTVAPWSPARRR
jgi:putative ABC transport system permease protein